MFNVIHQHNRQTAPKWKVAKCMDESLEVCRYSQALGFCKENIALCVALAQQLQLNGKGPKKQLHMAARMCALLFYIDTLSSSWEWLKVLAAYKQVPGGVAFRIFDWHSLVNHWGDGESGGV